METLNDTQWDVVISGTGLPPSLLALALSRSGKKILHVDRNDYYGGDEAALSLSEAEEWAKKHAGEPSDPPTTFSHASITQAPTDDEQSKGKLGGSRAYSLALAPHILHSKSALLPALVSSKTHSQLEFQAVGSWFLVNPPLDDSSTQPRLTRVPGGREDIFQDATLDLKAKRSLMKFLRFVVDYEEQGDTWEDYRDKPFSTLLQDKFGLVPASHPPILALALSAESQEDTLSRFAVPRVARYLTSIGLFGPGFGVVLPKWGGLAEIGQVACRACAVGGGVYVLGKGITNVEHSGDSDLKVHLTDGEVVTTKSLAGVAQDLPRSSKSSSSEESHTWITKSISIVSSPLASLFPPTSEGGVTPAGAVVVVQPPDRANPPVHVFAHSSESGECPKEQCVLYASVSRADTQGSDLLKQAVSNLLQSIGEQTVPQVLWSMHYRQYYAETEEAPAYSNVIPLQPLSPDLAFDDSMLDNVKSAWQRITEADQESFLKFESREGTMEDDDFA
ncbi:hypothetical protein M409DRAFT_17648 [Zasmidium cellare ATCC 36951]|uniref:Rab proteins geranylgeranyltransferase n=1 Tax=Zasmidium cellare ATCC 36951 TaxID=1080233 RepID=A0A6A6CZF4_ZASCE|nr:uncharacterized protein M409DRAFT_17648 [Zasmidium cellare ATCC 36951]KAF2172415.1 hypothetical protein M409DRAFT_17648 [Zasmidium cellare ATCC 36951]